MCLKILRSGDVLILKQLNILASIYMPSCAVFFIHTHTHGNALIDTVAYSNGGSLQVRQTSQVKYEDYVKDREDVYAKVKRVLEEEEEKDEVKSKQLLFLS